MPKPLGILQLFLLYFSCSLASHTQVEQPRQDAGSNESSSDTASRTREQEIELGSSTAKGGFRNEDEIRDKFNKWKKDPDARLWLEKMNYRFEDVAMVEASKPHGEKADIKVRIKTGTGEFTEGISIKLVSNPRGFNQIDKRWLKNYAQMWQMPESVHETLKLFVGEKPPSKPGRDPRRMFIDELDERQRTELIDFFTTHRERIVSDLFSGDGEHAAKWMMVTLNTIESKALDGKSSGEKKESPDGNSKNDQADDSQSEPKTEPKTEAVAEITDRHEPNWVLCTTHEAADFFGGGEIQITPQGSLKIGRITMQRKGGDNGRKSANMLQFKINPAELFERERLP